MTKKDKDCHIISFSDKTLKSILNMTKSHCKSGQKIVFIDNDRCDAIFLFIEKVLRSIRRHRIRRSIIYGAKNITFIRSVDQLEFEIAFKNKAMRETVFDKLHGNTKMDMTMKKKKGGSVISVKLKRGAAKR